MLRFAGETKTDVRASMNSVVEPKTPLNDASIDVVPAPTDVASPCGSVGLNVATLPSPDVHVTNLVITRGDTVEKEPVAVNCCVRPGGITAFAGVTVIDNRASTVRVAVPEVTPEKEAVISAVPGVSGVASPVELIVAAEVVEPHATANEVRFWELPSSSVAVAMNCCDMPTSPIVALGGLTAMETTGDTVITAFPPESVEDMPVALSTAIIEVCPLETPVASPVLSMLAIVLLDDCHLTWLFILRLEPFEKRPIALNCVVVSGAMLLSGGETAMDTSVAGGGGGGGGSPPPPQPEKGAIENSMANNMETDIRFI